MAIGQIRNTCSSSGPCLQFGDVSYLLSQSYETWIRIAVNNAPRIDRQGLSPKGAAVLFAEKRECRSQAQTLGDVPSPEDCAPLVLADDSCDKTFQWSTNTDWGCRCCKKGIPEAGNTHDAWNMYSAIFKKDVHGQVDESVLYVYPYTFEDYQYVVEPLGLRPRGTKGAIPPDIRSEHYGVLHARHMASRAHILMVDRRSAQNYLAPSEQKTLSSRCCPPLEIRANHSPQFVLLKA